MLQFILTTYLLLFSLNSVHGLLGEQCSIYDLRSNSKCGESEICDENVNSCQCAPGFNTVDNFCQRAILIPNTNENVEPNNTELLINNHAGLTIKGVLILTFLCVNIIVVILVMKKFNFGHWVRNKVYSFRRSNYDEFMIGQDVDDDPPLR